MPHPLLSLTKHKYCKDQIIDLDDCHRNHPIGKSFGYCNYSAMMLDECLKESVKITLKQIISN